MPWLVSADKICQKIDCKIYDLRLTSWHALHRAVWKIDHKHTGNAANRNRCGSTFWDLQHCDQSQSDSEGNQLCVYICVCIYIYMCIYICMGMYIYTYRQIDVYTHTQGSLKIGLNEEKIHSWVCKSFANSSTSVVMFKTEVWEKKSSQPNFEIPLYIFLILSEVCILVHLCKYVL